MKKYKIVFFLFFLISLNTFGKVSLPAVIGNNMVLQQKSEVALWGKAKTKSNVSIITSWDQKKYSVHSDDQGLWRTKVTTPSAGGPYQITFNDGEKLVLKNILIGEVWICSGQSNMEMPVKGFGNQP